MSAPVVIYAVGGGTGHALRGVLLQAALAETLGEAPELVVRRGVVMERCPEPRGPVHLSDNGELPASLAPEHPAPDATLVVDTFPHGWRDGLPVAAQRRSFARRILLARATHGGATLLDGAETFDATWLPYCERSDEWDAATRTRMTRPRRLGLLLRAAPWRLGGERRLAVLDPGGHADRQIIDFIERCARSAGVGVDLCRSYGAAVGASKALSFGAGYHTVFEAALVGNDVSFVPLARAFDDQTVRAARVGRLPRDTAELIAWLAAPDVAIPAPYARATCASIAQAWQELSA